MKKKMLAAVLAGTMVMSLGTNLCWADGEKTKVTMTVWNGEWGDQLDRTMESFNSKHDDIVSYNANGNDAQRCRKDALPQYNTL